MTPRRVHWRHDDPTGSGNDRARCGAGHVLTTRTTYEPAQVTCRTCWRRLVAERGAQSSACDCPVTGTRADGTPLRACEVLNARYYGHRCAADRPD